jgi:hypothetical protein
MKISSKIPDEVDLLELHVFGTGQGESILVRLPDGKWGVVDYFGSRRGDPSSNPAQAYLGSRGVEELEFVCLTHPHDDHYRGMSQLLERFPPRHLWLFPILDAKTAARLAEYLGLVELDSSDPQEAADELAKILDWCNRRNKPAAQCRLKYVDLGKDIYPSPEDTQSALRIRGIAPAPRLMKSYFEQLLACFRPDGTLQKKLPHRQHNVISVALMIEWNQTRIVLGGDVEREGWRLALEECPDRLCRCAAVKISHHGSDNGYCDGLWRALGDQSRTVAVLTPFHNHDLPDPEAIIHIEESVKVLCSTAPIVRIDRRLSAHSNASLESRQALRTEFQTYSAPSSTQVGRCSFFLDDRGQCVACEIDPPAFARGS